MKPVIAIICDFCNICDNGNQLNIGGSETWVVEISKQFANNGYYVMVFSQNKIWDTFNDNIEYIPIDKLENKISHIKINYTFIFRYIWKDTLNILSKYINNHQVFWVCHDTECYIDNKTVTLEDIQKNKWLYDNLNKFICMSDFCKECIQQNIPLPDSYFTIIGNGINFNFLPEVLNNIKDNSFMWSSRWERGLPLFLYKIFPYIKEKYPDSKIYVAQYNGMIPDEFINHNDIIFLGKLSKVQLYKEMQKHKVCFYPNFYPETFCITILEAILCDNEIVTVFDHGIKTTLQLFKSELIQPFFDFNDEHNQMMIANQIIHKLENYENEDRKTIRNIMKNYIYNEFSWENIYNKYKSEIFN